RRDLDRPRARAVRRPRSHPAAARRRAPPVADRPADRVLGRVACVQRARVDLAALAPHARPEGDAVARRDRRRRPVEPARAVAHSVLVPIVVICAVRGDVDTLGDLYAFGLLGAFVLTSAGLDLILWREGKRGPAFWLGVATTALVAVAFVTNLFAKWHAT